MSDHPQSPAVRIVGLRKTYRSIVAVDDLTMTVPLRGVHGFLGPNGSGKTTTIRMLLGLMRADQGTMELFGEPVPGRLPEVINRVGAIVEQPRFFENFSGRKNLALLAQGIAVPISRVGAVLEQVGLSDRAGSAFGTYSLGMKQRLAVAATLLKDPELLIFDEPTNGLDPQGIHEFRSTMRSLADAGRTVLVSSHILAEVQQIADTVTIIGRGRTLAEGPVASLLAGAADPVRVVVDDADRAAAVLRAAGLDVRPHEGALLVSRASGQVPPAEVSRLLGEQGLWISELTVQRRNLEELYLQLTEAGPTQQPDLHWARPEGAA
ncbi:ABC transporter ATP-binding protein [Micropruina glycogenica]|uniref:ABC transporter, ATP-binding protein n=1 Tax=Micropruina glycogenica TaxID=75385 RepID=A0A2N9JM06_9ACTN|nr:ATP-binding cassette domain-containing protein [Micropruina glycogenica]SPD88613.1 ABC transporter, ATP-binding protein [Micropruina glycogenica]